VIGAVTDPVLVLLHAFPLDRHVWDEVLDPLAATGIDVLVPDLRGFGESGRREDEADEPEVPDLAVMAHEVIAMLDRVGARTAVVAGLSLGGYVAMELLRQVPERIVGLLLVDTRATADSDEASAGRLAMADDLLAGASTATLAQGMVASLLGPASLARPEIVARVRRTIEGTDPRAIAWAQRAMAARPDSTATLAAFDRPALIVWGADDVLSPRSEQDLMLAALPAGELVVVSDSGHLSPLEKPREVATAISSLLARVPGAVAT
jgi:pimeloyl-ACP methyl ester carboxylesterase